MDGLGAWKFRVANRSLVLIIPLLIVVVVSLIWNVHQYRVIDHERQRTIATEQAKTEQEAIAAARAQARRERQTQEAAANERMQQLYREIDSLTQISDRLLTQPVRQSPAPSTPDNLETADGPP